MKNKFQYPMNLKRRLVSSAVGLNWNELLGYYGRTNPYPTWPYPPDEKPKYPGRSMLTDDYEAMLKEAQSYLGNAYLWGGKAPPNFDCSGFVGWLYKGHGLMPSSVISYTKTLRAYCFRIDEDEALPGDLCFWGGDTPEQQHIAIYIGNGYILDSASKGVDYRLVTYHNTVAEFLGYYRVPNTMPDWVDPR